jgi:hypothetical protein
MQRPSIEFLGLKRRRKKEEEEKSTYKTPWILT